MALFQRFAGSARRSQQFFQFGAVCRAKHWLAIIPSHRRAFIPVAEIVEVQFEAAIPFEPDQLSQLACILGLAIWSQPHYFVLVAEFGEPQVLSNRKVDKSDRMWKVGPIQHFQRCSAAERRRGTDEISEPI